MPPAPQPTGLAHSAVPTAHYFPTISPLRSLFADRDERRRENQLSNLFYSDKFAILESQFQIQYPERNLSLCLGLSRAWCQFF